MKLDYFTQWL